MHPVLWWFVLVCMVGGCAEATVRDRVAGAAELGAAALDVAAGEVTPAGCAALVSGGVALRGAASAVRSRSLPEVRVDLGRCGAVEPAAVSCEVEAWVPSTARWLSGVAGAAVAAAQDPAGVHVAAAVAVGACP